MTVQQGTCEWKSCVFPPAWTALFELPVSPREIPHQRRPCINYAIYHALGTACMRYSSRPPTRSCDSMSDNSSRARSSPALPLLGLFEWSLSTRRSAPPLPGLVRASGRPKCTGAVPGACVFSVVTHGGQMGAECHFG